MSACFVFSGGNRFENLHSMVVVTIQVSEFVGPRDSGAFAFIGRGIQNSVAANQTPALTYP
jgi:hypothetical protein